MAHVLDELKSPTEPVKAFVPVINSHQVVKKTIYVAPSANEYEYLTQLLKSRLEEGFGEAIIEVGTGECEMPGLTSEEMQASADTMQLLAVSLGAHCVLLRERHINATGGAVGATTVSGVGITPIPDGEQPTVTAENATDIVCEFLLRKKPEESDFMEIRVAVVGNVDAGKSTLLGVLTHGELDNGRGHARQKLFRHKHEQESGRTSSVGNDILGFDSTGNVVNKPTHGQLDWVKICEAAAKVITFIDLAGHERYLKTTVFGMTGHAPDYAMLMIGANAGVIGMTKEHLGLALALAVPVFVVVTKVDMCPANIMEDTMKILYRILKSPGCRKLPVLITNRDTVVTSATNFTSERICPIFKVSNVTGENLDLLTMFLNLLSSHSNPCIDEPAEFQIDDTFSVPGVGTVVSGTCLKGVIHLNDVLMLGPNAVGQFIPVPVKSIHRKRMPVRQVRGGQTASFSLKKIRRAEIRKGMVMVSPALDPKPCWVFAANVLILHHPTTISVKYQAMVHVGPVRQTATIIHMDKEHLRTGDKARVQFKFIKNPEYLKLGIRLVFREGKTKAVGTISEVFPHVAAVAQNTRQRGNKKESISEVMQPVVTVDNNNCASNSSKGSSKLRRPYKHEATLAAVNGVTAGPSIAPPVATANVVTSNATAPSPPSSTGTSKQPIRPIIPSISTSKT